jgi:hypothetical protein
MILGTIAAIRNMTNNTGMIIFSIRSAPPMVNVDDVS